MPNKFARQVPVADFNPRGVRVEGLDPVARPSGEEFDSAAIALKGVAHAFGKYADEAAALEGERAGKRAGLDPEFRPTGQTTIRGRNFEAAAKQTYLDQLDARMQRDMLALYDASKSNPGDLTAAYDKMQSQYLHPENGHVFADIEPDFKKKFDHYRLAFQRKALANQEADVKDRAAASLIENITSAQTLAARLVADRPNDPETAVILEAHRNKIGGLYDRAVANDVISAKAGAERKSAFNDDLTSRALLGKANALASPDEVAKFRDEMRKDFAAGKIRHLSADGFDGLDRALVTLERAKRTEGRTVSSALSTRIDDYVGRSAAGQTPPAGEWDQILLAAKAAPDGDAQIALANGKVKLAEMIRNAPIADADAMLRGLRQKWRDEGGVDKPRGDLLDFGENYLKEFKTGLQTDQLGTAQRKGLIGAVAPLDFERFGAAPGPASADMLAGQLIARAAQAKSVAASFERAPQFLRPEEKARLSEIVSQGGDRALMLAGAIVRGAGRDAPMVLREISSDAPVLAQAGVILSSGGSLAAARDAFAAAEIKIATGKELPGLPAARARELQRTEFGQAFVWQAEDGGRIAATADAIARTRMNRAGVNEKSSEADAIYRKALQEASGAVFVDGVQYGGVGTYRPGWWSNYKVAVPSGVRADAFRDVVRALRQEDFEGLAVKPQAASGTSYPVSDFAAAVPVAVRGGYRFALGDPAGADPKYIRGSDGRPFVLPFDQLAGVLRKRAPGAFLGGQ